jgi:uncharacterized protein
MKFNRRARLDTSQVSDRRGVGGRGVAIGGGVGGLIAVLIALLTGQNILDTGTGTTSAPASGGELATECQTGADVEQNPDCRFVVYVNSIQAYWEEEFARRGGQYTNAVTTVFTDAVQTGCGVAASTVGPFYCPTDGKVYLDLGFFQELQTKFGGSGGDFGEAYVLAHEYGHHVQNLTGQMSRVRTRQGAGSDAVRLELQADCYAGVWARHATSTPDETGQPLITELTQEDIREGLEAARIVGDDYIQERFQGTVTPETWTHGSSAQREQWFINGLQTGQLEACDTFSARL